MKFPLLQKSIHWGTSWRNRTVGHGRFDPVFIAGDEDEKEHNLSKARRLLGWTPQSHLELEV